MPVEVSSPASALRDQLAIDRTQLANERTLLAYLRTALALFLTGMSGVHLPDLETAMADARWYRLAGWLFVAASVVVTGVGYARFESIRRRIRHQLKQLPRVESTL